MMKLNIQLFGVSNKKTSFSEPALTENNIKNNTSSLTVSIQFGSSSSSSYFSDPVPLKCTVNGTTQSKNVTLKKGGLVTESFTFNNIPHNADGTKTVSWSWTCKTPISLGTVSASGTRSLQTVPRASVLNSFSISIANDETTKITPNITKYSSTFYDSLVVTAGAQSFTLSGVTNGTAVTLSVTDREKIFTAMGASTKVDISGYVKTGTSSSSPNDVGNSASKTATAELPNYTLSVTATLTDLNNDVLIGSKKISSFKPTTITMIKNLSKPRITYKVTSSTGKMYGRKISTSNAISKTNLNSGDSFYLDLATDKFNGSYRIDVTDGRKSTNATTTITVVNYTLPSVTASINRPVATGNQINYKVGWNYYGGSGLINLSNPTLVFKYKDNKTTSYTSKNIDVTKSTNSSESGTLGTNFNYKSSYDIQAVLTDKLGRTVTVNGFLGAGQPVWFAYKDDNGNLYLDVYGTLDVLTKILLNGQFTLANIPCELVDEV